MDSLKHTVHVIIPNQVNPSLFVRRHDGALFPSFHHERQQGTYEEQLHKFGSNVLGIAISVTRREISEFGELLYHTKPVNHTFTPDSPYQWR